MAIVTQEQLRGYRAIDSALKLAIQQELNTVWQSVAHLSSERITAAMTDAVPDIIHKYGSSSAAVAADWFEELMESRAVVPDLYSPDAYRASTRWALSPLYRENRNPREAFNHLVSASTRHMQGYGRRVLDYSVTRTPNAYYARVPTGPSTCEFCVVLASRGPVYTNRTEALYRAKDGDRYHSDCDCQPVPMRGRWVRALGTARGLRWEGDTVAGFDFEDLYNENYAPYHNSGDDIKTVVARMRDAK